MKFSAIYKPTTLFSLKDSNSTNSGAKSLFLPSPYSIKMAIINQAITIGGVDFNENENDFRIIRNAEISYFIKGNICVNNCFVKILKEKRDDIGFQETVSFREYIHFTDNMEIIFHVENELHSQFLKKYLHKINYFGKRGCFFQFISYCDIPSEPNVKDVSDISSGVLQEFDDISPKAQFKNVNNFDSANALRDKTILVIPVHNMNSSKSYTHYKCY